MKPKKQEETYELEVRCSNCSHNQTVFIPKGIEWHNQSFGRGSHYGEYGNYKSVVCEHCGCATLYRKAD